MLLNLSNHPSSSWTKAQTMAARVYGEIIDVPFPNVEPAATRADIQELAAQVVDSLQSFLCENLTVHVMGEMTLTYAIVSLLKIRDIRCVASTTKRIVMLNPDGTRTSSFQFVQFREY